MRRYLDKDALGRLLERMVEVPSPTGSERQLAELLVDYMRSEGLDAHVQAIAGERANAVGRIVGAGGGRDLLLYGHIDTHLSDDADADAPAFPRAVSPQRTGVTRAGSRIEGTGACNPKGYSAAMVHAACAIARADVALEGDLIVGMAAGGMPAEGGCGVGCGFMLTHGVRPDHAVIGKPGYGVASEEVGLCCFRIRAHGAFGYAGTRHVLENRNPIVHAGEVIGALEAWCVEYATRARTDTVAPQAAIGALRSGWPDKPSFVPAWADIYLDVRIAPGVDPLAVKRELRAVLDDLGERLDLSLELLVAIPGSRTPPEAWIVDAATRAFERVTGRPPAPLAGMSGASDADVLRAWGVPTARLGLSRASYGETPSFADEMDSVDLDELFVFTECVVETALETCTRKASAWNP